MRIITATAHSGISTGRPGPGGGNPASARRQMGMASRIKARSGVVAAKGVVPWDMAWASFGVQVSWQQVLACELRSRSVHGRIVGRLQRVVRVAERREDVAGGRLRTSRG